MHKVLLSVVLAILMVAAIVGVKKALAPAHSGTTLIAAGSAPQPPIPY